MRGSAVPTTVWSSELRNTVRRMAPITAHLVRLSRTGRVSGGAGLGVGSGATAVSDIPPCKHPRPIGGDSANPDPATPDRTSDGLTVCEGEGFGHGGGPRQGALRRLDDQVDARVQRDGGAVQDQVVVAYLLPGA